MKLGSERDHCTRERKVKQRIQHQQNEEKICTTLLRVWMIRLPKLIEEGVVVRFAGPHYGWQDTCMRSAQLELNHVDMQDQSSFHRTFLRQPEDLPSHRIRTPIRLDYKGPFNTRRRYSTVRVRCWKQAGRICMVLQGWLPRYTHTSAPRETNALLCPNILCFATLSLSLTKAV